MGAVWLTRTLVAEGDHFVYAVDVALVVRCTTQRQVYVAGDMHGVAVASVHSVCGYQEPCERWTGDISHTQALV